MKIWKTIYKCPCGKLLENGTGNFDSVFFLEALCPECGENKEKFERIGTAYWKRTPTIRKWFKGEYIFKK